MCILNHTWQTPRPQTHFRNQGLESSQFGDIYFNPRDPIAESDHVFIDGCDLHHRFNHQPVDTRFRRDYVIAELGFGAAINFCNTFKHWIKRPQTIESEPLKQPFKQHWLTYIAIEKYPLSTHDLQRLIANLPSLKELRPFYHELIQQYPLSYQNGSYQNGSYQNAFYLPFHQHKLRLFLIQKDVIQALEDLVAHQISVDSWFLDGFSPQKNQQMWTSQVFSVIHQLSHKHTNLASFSVSQQVKSQLTKCGFYWKKKLGILNKRETLIAVPSSDSTPRSAHQSSASSQRSFKKPPTIKIIGSGLAGLGAALALSKHQLTSQLYDLNAKVGMVASSHPQLIFKPQLTQAHGQKSQDQLQSYCYANQVFRELTPSIHAKSVPWIEAQCRLGQLSDRSLEPLWRAFGPPLYQLDQDNGLSTQARIINGQAFCLELFKHISDCQFHPNRYVDPSLIQSALIPEISRSDDTDDTVYIWATGSHQIESLVKFFNSVSSQKINTTISKLFGSSIKLKTNSLALSPKQQKGTSCHYFQNKSQPVTIINTYYRQAFDPCRNQSILPYLDASLNQLWNGVRVSTSTHQPLIKCFKNHIIVNGLAGHGTVTSFLLGECVASYLLNITPPLLFHVKHNLSTQ